MSYDLVFWGQPENHVGSPGDTYRRLVEREHVDGLEDIDIESMLHELQLLFPALVRERNGDADWATWTSENTKDSFQVEWTDQVVIVACRHIHSNDMNTIIDWAAMFGYPLFDPQTGERFTGAS